MNCMCGRFPLQFTRVVIEAMIAYLAIENQ
jgi:hypothetical protein